jgi:gliding motility-associated-like protein
LKNMSTMKKLSSSLLLLFTVVFVLFSATNTRANRAAAGEISYKWVSDSTYLLTYTFYKDCAGATAEPATINLCYYNTCNLDRGNVVLSKKTPLGSNGLPVSNVCSGLSSTTCSLPAGVISGYRKWVYEGNVTLPSKCDSWKFAVSIGLRNTGITNYTVPPASSNLYTEASLNNIDAPRSSSPTFALDPIQYMCSGVKQHFTFSGVDADGDVLTYTLIDPSSAADNQVTCTFPPTPTSYVFGGSSPGTSLATNPFATTGSFNLDNTTALMSFTPNGAQKPQLAMLVTKRRGAKVVGTVIREMQFVITMGCPPNGSALVATAATPAAFPAIPPGPPSTGFIVCPNVAHKLNISINANFGVAISNVSDNHLTFSATSSTSTVSGYSGLGTNIVSAVFDWTPTEADEGQQYLVVKSEICNPGSPKLYRVDSIPIYITYTVDIVATDTMICFGEKTNLCAVPSSVPGVAGITYTWGTTVSGSGVSTGTLGISTPLSPCTDVYPATTGYYLLESDLPGYCKRKDFPLLNTNQDQIKIVVVNPKIDVGPDTVLCAYSQLQMNGNLTTQPELTYTFRWRPRPGSVHPGPLDYLSDSTIINPICKVPVGATSIPDTVEYILSVIPNERPSCAKQDTIKIAILKGFYILTGDTLGDFTGLGHMGRQKGVSDTNICLGQSVVLEGWADQRYSYVWTPSTGVSTPTAFTPGVTTLTPPTTPTSGGTYTFALTASRLGCPDSTKLVNIEVEPIPAVDAGVNQSLCFGDTINMYASITPAPDVYTKYKYKWSPGGALSRADTFFTVFTGYLSSTITLVVTTPNGCLGKDSVSYTVQPRSFLTPGNDTIICPGDVAKISVTGDPQLKSITWKPITNIDSIHSQTPIVSPAFTTKYVVVGIDSNQCIDSTAVSVTVLPNAVIYLPDSATIYPGEFYQLSPQGNCLHYTWFPPSGLLDTVIKSNPRAMPQLNTTYYVTGTTDAGCLTKDSIHIFVAPDSYIDIPNAFIPGRGQNNVFKPVHLGTAKLKSLTVFNRWGVKMFETTNLNEGWDGSFGGQPQPIGVYVYVLEAITAQGKPINKQGNVTLIR